MCSGNTSQDIPLTLPKGYLNFLLYIGLTIPHKNSMVGENTQHHYARDAQYSMALLSTCFGFIVTGEKIFVALNSLCFTEIKGTPKLALLGIIPDGMLPVDKHTMWIRSLYLARKVILQKWSSADSPTHKQWVEKLNYTLKREKLTCKHRGTPQRFGKIWSCWIDPSNQLYDGLPSELEEIVGGK